MSTARPARSPKPDRLRTLTWLLAAAFLVSVVHYADGVSAPDQYPKSSSLPNPSPLVIGLAWLGFTAAGLAGYLRYRRLGPDPTGLLLLAGYTGSGLVGILHYEPAGALDLAWWRHVHIVLDIALASALLAFVWREARQLRPQTPAVQAPTASSSGSSRD